MVLGLLGVAGALALLSGLRADSGYGAIWPAFTLLGWHHRPADREFRCDRGQRPVDAGVAGGLQSTPVQLGAVLGTTILGSVLSSKVGSTLVGKLTAAAHLPVGRREAPRRQRSWWPWYSAVRSGAPPQLNAMVATGSRRRSWLGCRPR